MKKFFVISSILFLVAMLAYDNRALLFKKYALFFVVDTATKGADAILLLSGNLDARVKKAVKLYKEKYAKQLWTTTPFERKNSYPHILKPKNVILAEILTYENIDKLYILPSLKGGATSTFDEAYDLASYLKSNKVKRIIVVTDGFHTIRTKMAFDKIMKKFNITTKFEYAPAFSKDFDLNEWYKYEKSLYRLLVQEPLGLLFYYFSDANSDAYINM